MLGKIWLYGSGTLLTLAGLYFTAQTALDLVNGDSDTGVVFGVLMLLTGFCLAGWFFSLIYRGISRSINESSSGSSNPGSGSA